jgi:membrane fusion protein (multidrug efflux system)
MALLEDDQKPAEDHRTGSARAEAPSRHRDEQRPDSEQRESAKKKDGDQPTQPSWRDRMRSGLATMRRHPYVTAAVVAAVVAVLAAVLVWWLNARQYEWTDDAYIDTRTVPISAQITGAIVAVPVTDNQFVDKGAPLVRIDPRDYQAALEQAQASIANFQAQASAQQANIDQAQKQATQAQAALEFSQQQDARAQELVARGAGTVQQAQQTASDLTQKRAALAGAQSSVIAAQKQLTVLQAQLKSAQAAADKATIDLARTTIYAQEAGRIARLTAAVGAYAQPGQALMSLVPRNVWITANFKETQLADMRVLQPVDIRIDAYPGRTFHGHVDSLQAGSGAAFTLLPPENATGNFVKVVQRVPVKIVFDGDPGVYLGPGMSVVPSVKVR